MPKAGGRLHIAFLALTAYLYTGAKLSLDGTPPGESLGGFDPLTTLLQLLTLGVAALMAMGDHRGVLRRIRAMLPLWLLVGAAALSALWSASPEHTLRRSLAMVTLLLFVATTHAAIGHRRHAAVLVGSILGLAALSVMEAVLRPRIGFDVGDYANAIRGIYPQKNGFGAALLQGMLALSLLVLLRGRILRRDAAAAGALLVLLVLSRSTTALLLSLLVMGATVFLAWLDAGGLRRGLALAGAAMGLVLAFVLAVLGPEVLLDQIGKDTTLTGRTQLWEAIRPIIADRPLLGAGYAAFWTPGSREVQRIWDAILWEAPTAHSGYLEMLLQLGWLGLGLMGLAMASALVQALRGMAGGDPARRAKGRWAVILLVVLAIIAYSESALFNPDMLTVFLALALLSPVRETVRQEDVPPPRAMPVPARAFPAPRPALSVPVRTGQRFRRLR